MAFVGALPLDLYQQAAKKQQTYATSAVAIEKEGDGESSPPSGTFGSPPTGSAPQVEPVSKPDSERQSNGPADDPASTPQPISSREEPRPENWKSRPELEKLTLRYLGFESSPPAYIAPAQALVMKEMSTKNGSTSSDNQQRSAADMEVCSVRSFRARSPRTP